MNAVCISVSSSQYGQTHLGQKKHLALCSVLDNFNKIFQVISPRSPKAPEFLSWALLDFRTLLISNMGNRSTTQIQHISATKLEFPEVITKIQRLLYLPCLSFYFLRSQRTAITKVNRKTKLHMKLIKKHQQQYQGGIYSDADFRIQAKDFRLLILHCIFPEKQPGHKTITSLNQITAEEI